MPLFKYNKAYFANFSSIISADLYLNGTAVYRQIQLNILLVTGTTFLLVYLIIFYGCCFMLLIERLSTVKLVQREAARCSVNSLNYWERKTSKSG